MNSPNLDAYGSGDVKKEFYRSNVHDDSQGDFPSDLAFARIQESVKAQIKDPLSKAIGFHYKSPHKNNSVLFPTDYFFAIDRYAMLETSDDKSLGDLQFESTSEAEMLSAIAKTNQSL